MVRGRKEGDLAWSAIHFLILRKKVSKSLPFLLRAPGVPFLFLVCFFLGISYLLLGYDQSPSELSSRTTSISLRSQKCGSYSFGFWLAILESSGCKSLVDAIFNIFPFWDIQGQMVQEAVRRQCWESQSSRTSQARHLQCTYSSLFIIKYYIQHQYNKDKNHSQTISKSTLSLAGRTSTIASFVSFISAAGFGRMKSRLLKSSSLVSLWSFSVKSRCLVGSRICVMISTPLMSAYLSLAQRGWRVWQFSMKVVFTSLQGFSSARNFSSWKNSSTSSIGRHRYTTPMQAHRMDSQQIPSLICASKIISPIARKNSVASTSFMARMLSSPLTFSLMLQRRRRVYLSVQQKRTIPMRISRQPAGITEQQRYVNQMDSMSSAYFLPMLYLGSSIRACASRWVRSLRPLESHRLKSLKRYQGLMIQMMGTRKALKKNIMLSSSTTPNSSLQMLCSAKSSTNSVMMAVVKNSPRVYFSPKENQYSLPVRCFSMSVKRCRTKERQNLLKKMMLSMASIVTAVERSVSMAAAGSLGFSLMSFRTSSTRWPLAVRMPQKTPVIAAMKRAVRVHPIISLTVRFEEGQLMFSQIISLGSGASSISMSSAPSPKNSVNLSFSIFSQFYKNSSLASSLSMTMTAFSHGALSLLINPTCLSCSFSSLPLTFASIRSNSAIFCARPSPSCFRSHICFSRITASFSSLISQQSSRWFSMISSSTVKAVFSTPLCMNSRMRLPLPGRGGSPVIMTEQSDREVVRSSQQSLVFLMVSRMQSSVMRWMRKEDSRSTTSSRVTFTSVRMNRSNQLVHMPSVPSGSSLTCPSRQISCVFSNAQVIESAEQVTS